ncbi:MAG TPA: hypothetical protein VFR90_06035 [Methylibium sp.]|nr:hypothetical protein [Methylibium sp.]
MAALAWAAQRGDAPWRYVAAFIGIAVAASWMVELRMRPAARLRWDGAVWRLASPRPDDDGLEGEASVAIDLGDRLLLRFVPTGRRLSRWLPLHRNATEGDWHALRCALHARRPGPATPATAGAIDA